MPKSVQEQIRAELEKKREADKQIEKLKAREATRIGRIADRVGLYEIAVSDDELAAGFRHAIELAERRARDGTTRTEDAAPA